MPPNSLMRLSYNRPAKPQPQLRVRKQRQIPIVKSSAVPMLRSRIAFSGGMVDRTKFTTSCGCGGGV